jgi:hypothetical protein
MYAFKRNVDLFLSEVTLVSMELSDGTSGR